MNRLQNYYEQLQFPLKVMFLGSVFIGLGLLLTNPFITSIFILDNPVIMAIAHILLYTGGLILSYFILLFIVKLLDYKIEEPNIYVTLLISYVVFSLILMLMADKVTVEGSYSPNFVFKIGESTYELFKTGIFGIGALYLWIRFLYKRDSGVKSLSYGYLDRKIGKLLIALIGSVIIGVIFAWLWPIIVNSIYSFMQFVSLDSSNPMSMFSYGLMERILTLGGLDSILHEGMWFSELGGSWVSPTNGTLYVGDVNMWAAQLSEKTNVLGLGGSGRYTSAYYVLNLFAVPGYLMAIYTITTNRKNRINNLLLFLGAVLLSWISGVLFPIELVMLLTAPSIYGFHLFMTSFVYAVLAGLNVNIGFSYLGSLLFATPGNIVDLLGYVNNAVVFNTLQNSIYTMLLIGIVIGALYFIVVHFYYSRLAMDPLNITNKEDRITDIIEFLGGVENIENIDNTPMHIYISLKDRSIISVNGLHRQGVTRIVETKNGFILTYGGGSYSVQQAINKKIKAYKESLEEEVVNE